MTKVCHKKSLFVLLCHAITAINSQIVLYEILLCFMEICCTFSAVDWGGIPFMGSRVVDWIVKLSIKCRHSNHAHSDFDYRRARIKVKSLAAKVVRKLCALSRVNLALGGCCERDIFRVLLAWWCIYALYVQSFHVIIINNPAKWISYSWLIFARNT